MSTAMHIQRAAAMLGALKLGVRENITLKKNNPASYDRSSWLHFIRT